MARFPYAKTFLLGFGFFGISVIWPIFNNFVPIFLAEMGLRAALVGFVMTWDNYLNMFVQPIVGERSDHTRSRLGRRKPWMLVGAPIAATAFLLIPSLHTVIGIMLAILLTNLGMALFRSPTVALLGDLYPPEQRSTANGVINLMGGVGAIVAFLGGGALYAFGRITPFLFGSLILLGAITLVLLFVREPTAPANPASSGPRQGLLRNLREVLESEDRSGFWILAAILCWFLGFNALETWISSFGKFTLGIDPGRMSLITSGFALLFVIFAVPSGLFATRFGRKRTVLGGVVALTVLMAMGWLVRDTLSLVALLVAAGIAWALVNVNSLPMVYDVGGDARVGAFTGLYYLASNIAAVGGPQVVGLLIDWTGGNYRVMFLFSAIFMALATLCMTRVREHPRPSASR